MSERSSKRVQMYLDHLKTAEADLFTDPAKRIAPGAAKLLLGNDEYVDAYHHEDGEWPCVKVDRELINAAIDRMGGAELSRNCPKSAGMLAVRIGPSIWYVHATLDIHQP